MRYKLLGHSGLRVSEAALGTMTFGEAWGWGASKEESKRMFEAYVEAGGNFFDTANLYTDGQSERFLGEFIQAERDRLVLGSKFSLGVPKGGDLNLSGNHRKSLEVNLRQSLQRLQTDYLDVLWLHAWDKITPLEGVMRALDDAVKSGRVLHIAVSDTPAWVVSRANTLAELRGWTPFCATQVEYSLIERTPERDLIPMAQALGLATTAWGALGSGVLSGKYGQGQGGRVPEGHARRSGKNLEIARSVETIAQSLGATSAQVALAWVASKGVIPLVGARTLAQLQDNLGYLQLKLSKEQIQQLEAASPLELGFPHQMLSNNPRLFGGLRDQLEAHPQM